MVLPDFDDFNAFLDLTTGTSLVEMPVAKAVTSKGSVIGVDTSNRKRILS